MPASRLRCNRGVKAGSGDIVVLLNNDVLCPARLSRAPCSPARQRRCSARLGGRAAPGAWREADRELRASQPTGRLQDSLAYEASRPRRATWCGPLHLVGPSGRCRRLSPGGVGTSGTAWTRASSSYGKDVDLALRLRAAGWFITAAVPGSRRSTSCRQCDAPVGLAAISRSASHAATSSAATAPFASGAGLRAGVTEAIVVLLDAVVFSHDLAAVRGRVAGWRAVEVAARGNCGLPHGAIDDRITLGKAYACALTSTQKG